MCSTSPSRENTGISSSTRRTSDTSLLTGGSASIRLDTRLDGINYYGVETLNLRLGSGDDRFQVKETNLRTVTNLDTGAETTRSAFTMTVIPWTRSSAP